LFAVISVLIFLVGIPAFWCFLPAAIVLGCGVALIIHVIRHETPGNSWVLPATRKEIANTQAMQGHDATVTPRDKANRGRHQHAGLPRRPSLQRPIAPSTGKAFLTNSQIYDLAEQWSHRMSHLQLFLAMGAPVASQCFCS
jgi:hypothetical protein